MPYNDLIVEKRNGMGFITLNRPKVLNALSQNVYRELDEAISDMEGDSEIKVILLTGSGERAFSAGADIHELARMAEDPTIVVDPKRSEYPWHIASCTKPTIGIINGLAFGGGATLASGLDIRIGCSKSSFKFLAASYGRVNSTWSLPMQVGWPMAKELLLTGREINADEAYRIGLLNHLVPSDQLVTTAVKLAEQIVANDSRMVQGIKELMIQDIGLSWKEMYETELRAMDDKLKPTPILEGFKPFLDRKGRK